MNNTAAGIKVSSRNGRTVHVGYSRGPGLYGAMCGQAGNFGRAYRGEVNCTKCLAAHGQGSDALAAAKAAR